MVAQSISLVAIVKDRLRLCRICAVSLLHSSRLSPVRDNHSAIVLIIVLSGGLLRLVNVPHVREKALISRVRSATLRKG